MQPMRATAARSAEKFEGRGIFLWIPKLWMVRGSEGRPQQYDGVLREGVEADEFLTL